MTQRSLAPLALLALGLAAWAYALSQLPPSAIHSYGLLASAPIWFPLGLAALLAGFLIELTRPEPRGWLLVACLVVLVVAIYTAAPVIYGGTPEYAWTYKHVGVAQSLGHYGRVTQPWNIYQRWPAFFAGVAGVSALGHVGALSFAAWAPVAFELADALLLMSIFCQLVRERRVAFIGVLIYVGLVAWIGQDYLAPQAFGYLLWLGIVAILLRWLRAPPAAPKLRGRLARLRARLLAGLEAPLETTTRQRLLAVALVTSIFFSVVAAHQLTPFMALAGVGALTLLDLVRPRWLWLLLAAITAAYLAPRFSFVAENFGVVSSVNPVSNASGVKGAYYRGPEAMTAWICRALAFCMWTLTLAVIVRRRRELGRVAIPALLAFSPFALALVQNYGGEAIYRIYLFSAPWCSLLIASALYEVRSPLRRWLSVGVVCTVVLYAGLQGLYGPIQVDSASPDELAASVWLYDHIPRGSMIALPARNFPAGFVFDYNAYDVQFMPADYQITSNPWMDEGSLNEVNHWVATLGHRSAYVVVNRGMYSWSDFYGYPTGFKQLVRKIPTAPGWSVVYRSPDVTIYRMVVSPRRT
jgi:hypothetical protein